MLNLNFKLQIGQLEAKIAEKRILVRSLQENSAKHNAVLEELRRQLKVQSRHSYISGTASKCG